MQLCHVGYGHGATHHNLAGPALSLWTPGGEHPVEPPDRSERSSAPSEPMAEAMGAEELSDEELAQLEAMQAQVEQVQAQLLAVPASVVVVNHAMGLYELAALHLMRPQPDLVEASLAIDALGALSDGLRCRPGEDEQTVRDALMQLRAAYLEVRSRQEDDKGDTET